MTKDLQKIHYDENGAFVICHKCKNRAIDVENDVENFIKFITVHKGGKRHYLIGRFQDYLKHIADGGEIK